MTDAERVNNVQRDYATQVAMARLGYPSRTVSPYSPINNAEAFSWAFVATTLILSFFRRH